MSRVRVYELAKQLSISNKEVLDLLEEYGMPASNHMMLVDDNAAEFVIRRVRRGRPSLSHLPNAEHRRFQAQGHRFCVRSAAHRPRLRRGDEGRQAARREEFFSRRSFAARRTAPPDGSHSCEARRPFRHAHGDDGKLINFDTTTYFRAVVFRQHEGHIHQQSQTRGKPKKDHASPAVETSKAVPKEAAEELQEPAGSGLPEPSLQRSSLQGSSPMGPACRGPRTGREDSGTQSGHEAAELEQTARGGGRCGDCHT